MDTPLHITSEIGKLKTVLLHRPGEELENLTPEYLPDLLFDDIPYLEKAKAEHDAFADALRDRGVEVLYLDELATEALDSDETGELRTAFVTEMLTASKQSGRRVSEALSSYLLAMDTNAMVRKVMAGIRKNEVKLPKEGAQQLHEMLDNSFPFYLNPMPNLYFTRDTAAAIGNGLTLNRMHWPARRREGLFMEYIMSYHPRFADYDIPAWYTRNERFSVEGGDELVLNKHTVAIGISERTTPEAIERIAQNLFTHTDFTKVIALQIPKTRAFMHLDTVFTMIDHDKFSVHPEAVKTSTHMNIFVLEPSDDPEHPNITHESDLAHVLRVALNIPHVEFIECGNGDPIAAAREQWNDGSNTLAIAPGVVITYDRNYVTNQALRDHGIEVIEVPGAEVGRGRGGPRCMSMPLIREDV